ncbi:MAG: amidohydrolase family protein [Candidatus Marinimicrobia bacterium]|nr:amidohydrolase family protein [Candidatus Neomarinimicrobiota bacterium]MCF7839631.1 amidohydrolase family protein [Candidatus Neomarinimicrobiota bacterium]
MNKVLTHLRILRPYSEPDYMESGWIRLIDGRIAAFGEMPVVLEPEETEINLAGKLVLPGMINAHTHLYSALAMGMSPPSRTPTNFNQILESVWWRLDRALDEDSIRASFQAGLLACLRAGVTTVFDHHSSPNWIKGSLKLLADIAREMGIKISLAYEVTDRNGADIFQDALEENLDAMERYRDDPVVHPMLGLHASFTLSDESLETVRRALDDFPETGIHIHLAEDITDHHDSGERGYQSVVQRLSEYDLIHSNSLYAHGIHITPDDADTLFNSNANLVHNPTSNANNRVGILNGVTLELLGYGLGTDGMQANLLDEARTGALIRSSKMTQGQPNVDYLKLLFENNPRIASKLFGYHLSRIEPGVPADLVFYDYHARTELSEMNWPAHLLYGLGQPDDVMTDGAFMIRNGDPVGIDEHEILKNARITSGRLWKTIEALK